MTKTISHSISRFLRCRSVITATTIFLISVQVSAETNPIAVDINNKSSGVTVWSPANGFADLIEQVSPAVVHVATSGVSSGSGPEFSFPDGSPFEDFFEQFRNQQQPQQEERSRPLGIGSGFIISQDGYVVTNNHVINDADEIIVTMTNGDEFVAELQGTDSKTDLALLKLNNVDNLPYVEFGDADASRVGDWVIAIGNPFGLGGSASTGIISARGRDINSGPYDDYIQVDAAINRGNSGGPLFNLQGQVIGINTAIYSPNGGSVGIGFSIPSTLAENVIYQLRDAGEVERAWIGVQIQPLDKELAEGFGRQDEKGALIASVVPNKPAGNAGLQTGDIILSFDGQDIEEMRDLPKIVAQSAVGDKFDMEVWRDGKIRKMTITTDRFPDDDAVATLVRPDATPQLEEDDVFGATLSELTDEMRNEYSISDDISGLIVLNVRNDGLAAQNGIRQGDVITSVNNASVDKVDDVAKEIEGAKRQGRDKIVVLLQRNTGSRFIPFNLNEN